MELYTSKEVCASIPGIATRTLIDLVEKGIVTPTKQSGGRGEHRLYSKDDILRIMFATAIRGMFSPILLMRMMAVLKKSLTKDIAFIVFTFKDRSDREAAPHYHFIYENDEIAIKDLMVGFDKINEEQKTAIRKNIVDKFASTYVNLAEMKRFINKRF